MISRRGPVPSKPILIDTEPRGLIPVGVEITPIERRAAKSEHRRILVCMLNEEGVEDQSESKKWVSKRSVYY